MADLTNETFGGTWPYKPRFYEHDGVKLHYVDEGEGDPIVMLHGNPTWGYLYRNFIPPLSQTNRCVAPDHMGFGKSDKPLDKQYTLARHIENFTALMDELELKDITLVMQDWGGPIGLGFGVEHAGRIKRLVILNTWAFRIPEGSPLAPLLELFRQPNVGEAMVQGLNLFVEGFLPAGIYHKEKLDTFMPAYRAPFPDWNSRIGTLEFPRDIPVGDDQRSSETMAKIQDALVNINVPTTIIWGMQDPAIPPPLIEAWKGVYPHAEEHRIETASHFLQEDEPEQIVELIQDFLRANP
ncbi:MAG: alpha/beta fold hydrolase [Chloroflexi bacterium]|nr:alpha/beta fold hydrolase [Chloroflexota bacterium]